MILTVLVVEQGLPDKGRARQESDSGPRSGWRGELEPAGATMESLRGARARCRAGTGTLGDPCSGPAAEDVRGAERRATRRFGAMASCSADVSSRRWSSSSYGGPHPQVAPVNNR